MPLSDIKIRNAKPKDKPYKLTDGAGLFLLITPSGGKLWKLKYRFLGKEKQYALGAYPLVGLLEAREIRANVKKLLASGIDPTQHRRLTKQQKMDACENTFESVARRWLSIKKIEDSHHVRSLRRLELHAFPRLGFRPIGEIKTIELANCLEAIERGGIIETANRIKQLMQQVFRYAVRRGIIEHNPAGDLRDIIGHADVKNRACIPPAELPILLKDMKRIQGRRTDKIGNVAFGSNLCPDGRTYRRTLGGNRLGAARMEYSRRTYEDAKSACSTIIKRNHWPFLENCKRQRASMDLSFFLPRTKKNISKKGETS